MLTLSYVLIAAVACWLIYWGLDAQFHLTHQIKRWRDRRLWRKRNAREGRGRQARSRNR